MLGVNKKSQIFHYQSQYQKVKAFLHFDKMSFSVFKCII